MKCQILNRPWGSMTTLRLGLCALSVVTLNVMATPPSMKTIGQLYREENGGDDPDRMMNGGIWGRVIAMDKGIPRDFPVPASSRDLKVSGVIPNASVTGTMALAEAFYTEILPRRVGISTGESKFQARFTGVFFQSSLARSASALR